MRHKGYISGNFDIVDVELAALLRKCKEQCETLVLGIPTDELIMRMTDRNPRVSYENRREYLLSFKSVDEVVPVDANHISKEESCRQVGYDTFFYGGEYGIRFEKDRLLLEKKGVKMVSIVPDRLAPVRQDDALAEAMRNVSHYKKIVLFGTGKYFENYVKKYAQEYPPTYAVDNSPKQWNTRKMGVAIKNPEILRQEDPDNTIIVLCCKEYSEVVKQIKAIGNFDFRPMLVRNECAIVDEYALNLLEEKTYMEKAHAILKKLMAEFDRVCQEYNLQYYVISGSLIGVVRHQGMIPWDDDIDVAMPRRDFMILKEKAADIWRDSDFEFVDYDQLGNGAFLDFMTRLVYMKEEIPTRIFRKVKGKARDELQNRLVLDIYVLDNVGNNEKKHKYKTTMIKGAYALAMGHRAYLDYGEYDLLSGGMRFLLRLVNSVGRLIPLKWIFAIYERLRTYAQNEPSNAYFESNGVINYMPWVYDRSLYGTGITMPMWDLQVKVPADYDGLLRAKGYGDYMVLPPVNNRKPSHYIKAKGIIW